METVSEALGLLKRQAELEASMDRRGAFCLREEQELQLVRRLLLNIPEASGAAIQTAHALRRRVTEVSVNDVESWAKAAHGV